jgi:hypothetical protein
MEFYTARPDCPLSRLCCQPLVARFCCSFAARIAARNAARFCCSLLMLTVAARLGFCSLLPLALLFSLLLSFAAPLAARLAAQVAARCCCSRLLFDLLLTLLLSFAAQFCCALLLLDFVAHFCCSLLLLAFAVRFSTHFAASLAALFGCSLYCSRLLLS